jgi:nucleotide-binding universal stress UspA family protein
MARVVVGLDGSAQSLQALEHAGRFARAFEHELVGVHVVDPIPEETISPEKGRLRVAQMAARLERDMAGDLARFDGRMRTVYLRAGEKVAPALVRAAAEEGAVLLAVATRSTGRWRRSLLGSVALEVLDRDHLPLMLTGPAVEPPSGADSYRVLFLSDDPVGAAALARLLHPAMARGEAHVTVLHVNSSGEPSPLDENAFEQRVARIEGLLSPNDTVTGRLEHVSSPEEVLGRAIKVATEIGADGFALATSSNRLKRRLWGGSTALSLLARSPLPLIVVSRL